MALNQETLFGPVQPMPEGFRYQEECISIEEERALIAEFEKLPFSPYMYEGYEAKRRIVYYGLEHDFDTKIVRQGEQIPAYLMPLQTKAAAFAGIALDQIVHALVTEYVPGTPIGWHRDSPPFDKVIGVSFNAPCQFRMRREVVHSADAGPMLSPAKRVTWERFSVVAAPRSIYLMEGPARYVWQHSIPPLAELRYSVTFRTLR